MRQKDSTLITGVRLLLFYSLIALKRLIRACNRFLIREAIRAAKQGQLQEARELLQNKSYWAGTPARLRTELENALNYGERAFGAAVQ